MFQVTLNEESHNLVNLDPSTHVVDEFLGKWDSFEYSVSNAIGNCNRHVDFHTPDIYPKAMFDINTESRKFIGTSVQLAQTLDVPSGTPSPFENMYGHVGTRTIIDSRLKGTSNYYINEKFVDGTGYKGIVSTEATVDENTRLQRIIINDESVEELKYPPERVFEDMKEEKKWFMRSNISKNDLVPEHVGLTTLFDRSLPIGFLNADKDKNDLRMNSINTSFRFLCDVESINEVLVSVFAVDCARSFGRRYVPPMRRVPILSSLGSALTECKSLSKVRNIPNDRKIINLSFLKLALVTKMDDKNNYLYLDHIDVPNDCVWVVTHLLNNVSRELCYFCKGYQRGFEDIFEKKLINPIECTYCCSAHNSTWSESTYVQQQSFVRTLETAPLFESSNFFNHCQKVMVFQQYLKGDEIIHLMDLITFNDTNFGKPYENDRECKAKETGICPNSEADCNITVTAIEGNSCPFRIFEITRGLLDRTVIDSSRAQPSVENGNKVGVVIPYKLLINTKNRLSTQYVEYYFQSAICEATGGSSSSQKYYAVLKQDLNGRFLQIVDEKSTVFDKDSFQRMLNYNAVLLLYKKTTNRYSTGRLSNLDDESLHCAECPLLKAGQPQKLVPYKEPSDGFEDKVEYGLLGCRDDLNSMLLTENEHRLKVIAQQNKAREQQQQSSSTQNKRKRSDDNDTSSVSHRAEKKSSREVIIIDEDDNVDVSTKLSQKEVPNKLFDSDSEDDSVLHFEGTEHIKNREKKVEEEFKSLMPELTKNFEDRMTLVNKKFNEACSELDGSTGAKKQKLMKKMWKFGKGRLIHFTQRTTHENETKLFHLIRSSTTPLVLQNESLTLSKDTVLAMIKDNNVTGDDNHCLTMEFIRYYIKMLKQKFETEATKLLLINEEKNVWGLMQNKFITEEKLKKLVVCYVNNNQFISGVYAIEQLQKHEITVSYFDTNVDKENLKAELSAQHSSLYDGIDVDTDLALVIKDNFDEIFGGNEQTRSFNGKNRDLYSLLFLYNKTSNCTSLVFDDNIEAYKKQMVLAVLTDIPDYI